MSIFHSVKWYEPLHTGPKPDQIFVPWAGYLTLPAGRGWHEQTLSNEDHAAQLADALRVKGFVLVEVRRFTQASDGLRIDV